MLSFKIDLDIDTNIVEILRQKHKAFQIKYPGEPQLDFFAFEDTLCGQCVGAEFLERELIEMFSTYLGLEIGEFYDTTKDNTLVLNVELSE